MNTYRNSLEYLDEILCNIKFDLSNLRESVSGVEKHASGPRLRSVRALMGELESTLSTASALLLEAQEAVTTELEMGSREKYLPDFEKIKAPQGGEE